MSAELLTGKDMSSPVGRWSGLGPYYAMFPIDFAFEVVRNHSKPGDSVLDPFAGRGTSVYAAAMQDRTGIGIEINPVGWLYGQVKLEPASEAKVLRRLDEIAAISTNDRSIAAEVEAMPTFFNHCYSHGVLKFLLCARRELAWQSSRVDRTLMSLILVYLHGKTESALSNQMRQGKAMSPDYSVRWWTERSMVPPILDARAFLRPRIEWRYKKGIKKAPGSRILLGNSITVLPRIRKEKLCKLLFTSPPYYSITNYHTDQWLRLWMLGGPDRPRGGRGEWQRKFESQVAYERLLRSVFTASAKHLADDAIIYVRTDARKFTLEKTQEILSDVFPEKKVHRTNRPLLRQSQTSLFGDKNEKPGEVDLVLS